MVESRASSLPGPKCVAGPVPGPLSVELAQEQSVLAQATMLPEPVYELVQPEAAWPPSVAERPAPSAALSLAAG
jgi:hypothetical protein